MAVKTEIPRYDIRQVQKVITMLEIWIDSSQESLDNEESKDSPNDERVETLTSRIESLANAKESLEEIEQL